MNNDLDNFSIVEIFSLLGNEIRFNILKLVHSEPRSFSELLTYLSLESSSKLSFHINKLDGLIIKRNDEKYDVTDVGERAYLLITSFESNETWFAPTTQNIIESSDMSHKTTDVYICSATQDQDIRKTISQLLEKQKITCWIESRDLDRSKDYFKVIKEAILSSKIILFLCSTYTITSHQVRNEIALATQHEIPVIPVKIENMIPPDEISTYLESNQWMEAYKEPLEDYLDEIIHTIQSILHAKTIYTFFKEKMSIKSLPPIDKKTSLKEWLQAYRETIHDVINQVTDTSKSNKPKKKLTTGVIFDLPHDLQPTALAFVTLTEGTVEEIAAESKKSVEETIKNIKRLQKMGYIGNKGEITTIQYFCSI